jgi:hypothetical protein
MMTTEEQGVSQAQLQRHHPDDVKEFMVRNTYITLGWHADHQGTSLNTAL